MLLLETLIVDTHSDYEPYVTIVAGFDDARNLVIRMDCERAAGDNAQNTHRITDAVVSGDGAYALARRYQTSLTQLPSELSDCMHKPLDKYSAGEVKEVFSELLHLLLERKIPYKIKNYLRFASEDYR